MTLPNFLIIGAAKAGTTSLWHYLRRHPQVYMSPLKEPKFLAIEDEELAFRGPPPPTRPPWAVTDLEAYRALFAGVSDETAVGEISPAYLYSEKASERIRRRLADASSSSCCAIPPRAYSQFLHMLRSGREPLTDFARVLDAEEERVREHWWPDLQYTRIGFYYEQLSRYCRLFRREQIRVYLYEELEADPSRMMRDVFGFLGVDDAFLSAGRGRQAQRLGRHQEQGSARVPLEVAAGQALWRAILSKLDFSHLAV